MILGFNNNAASRIASDITSLQTTIPVDPNTGALFAKALTTDISNPSSKHKVIAKVTLSDLKQTVWEICHLTAVDGDTLTVIRGQEGTTQRSWKLGDLIGNFSTRGSENNFLQIEQLQGGDYIYAEAKGDGNTLVVSIPSTYMPDSWDFKAPLVISPNANNSGAVKIQLILGGMTIGALPVYKLNSGKLNKSQLFRNDIIAGIPFVVVLSANKSFFNILNPASIFGDYFPKAGGTITGSVTVQKDLTVNGTNAIRNATASKLALETNDQNKNGFTFQQISDVLRLGISKNGELSDTLAYFDAKNKNIDFHANALTKNQISIATVQTEYWYIGGTSSRPLRIRSGNEYQFSNAYGGDPVIFIPQLYINKEDAQDNKSRWIEVNGIFTSGGFSSYTNDGFSFKTAEILNNDGTISHQVGIRCSKNSLLAPNTSLSQIPSAWIKNNVPETSIRIKVIKLSS